MESSLDESFDNAEEFHSTSESPSLNGDLGLRALLAFQLVRVCVALHQRSKSHHGTSYPLGLPHLLVKRKGRISRPVRAEAIIEDTPYERSSSELAPIKNDEGLTARSQSTEASLARTEDQPWNAPTMEKFVIKNSTSQTHVESFPLLRRRTRTKPVKDHSSDMLTQHNEEDDFGYSQVKVSKDKHLDIGPLKELQPKRYVEREFDSVYDNEGSSFEDGDALSCVLGQRECDNQEESLMDQGIRRIMESDPSTIEESQDDYLEESTISSGNFSKRSSAFPLGQHKNHEAGECEDGWMVIQKKVENASEDGSNLEDTRLQKSRYVDQMPEEGQLDSVLLWPLGIAREAISFQVRLVAQAFALIVLVYNWCNSFTSNRVRETLQAKERATESLNQKISIITNAPPKVTESGSVVLKRAAWGCFAATYVCILLSMLLLPVLCLDYVFLSKIVEEPVNVKEPLHFDYTLPHPTAVVFLHPLARLQNSMGKFGSHQEHARAIPIAQKVHITVLLTLPESDYNRNLGMFQLSAELLSGNGQSIKSSSRPCMLQFHSLPIRILRTFLVSLPSLVGVITESQTLAVHLMEFEEQQVATNAVQILLQPKAGIPAGQGIPEIYSAYVHIESHLPCLKNLMRNWKWTVYIWTGLMLYVAEVIMVLCCCRQALLPNAWMGLHDDGKAEQLDGNTPGEVHRTGSSETQLLRKRRQHSLNEHIPTARPIVDRREHKLRQGGSHSRTLTS